MSHKPSVNIPDIDHSGEVRRLESILMEYARKNGKKIQVSNPHHDYIHPCIDKDVDLCIYFWCSPVRTRDKEFPYAYGYRVNDGQHDGFQEPADSEGTRIVDTEGEIVALFLGKTLYVLFDLPHGNDRGEENFADKILKCILNDVYLCEIDKEGFEMEMKKRLGEAGERRFVRRCKETLDIFAGDTERAEAELRRAKVEFLTALRRKNEQRREKFFGEAVKFAPENLEKLYETLCRLSATGSIGVKHQTICIPIGQIDIEYDGTIYDIGKFEIWIGFFNEGLDVVCVNTTRIVDGYHHPHVNEKGEPCLGDLSRGVERLVSEGDVVSLVLVMRDILRSYNENGPFHDVDDWPVRRVLRPAKED